ncbi:hypothetical protein BJ912DRAFT_846225, partial [Pholiota molesta]
PETPSAVPEGTEAPTSAVKKEKGRPYVNPERVKTGGAQRDKLTDEALQERMARIREQNEKIKQRRLDVQADEDAFRKTQEVDRARQAQNRKVQSEVDRARDQNAKRKMDKAPNREWDSGKPAAGGTRQQAHRSEPQAQRADVQPTEGRGDRGGGGGGDRGGRGRGGRGGRGRGGNRESAPRSSAHEETEHVEVPMTW